MKTLTLGQNATKMCLICAFMTKIFADGQNTIALPLIITNTILKKKLYPILDTRISVCLFVRRPCVCNAQGTPPGF